MSTISSLSSSVNEIKKFSGSPVVRSRRDRGLTPPTDRGVESTHNSQSVFQKAVFSLDWVKFTVHASRASVDALLSLLGVLGALDVIGHGGTGFKTIESGLNGFQLYSEPVEVAREYLSFNLPSKFIQSLGHDKLLKVHDWLCESGLRFNYTRFDIAFDQQDFITSQFVEAWASGHVKTRAAAFKEIESNEGHTFYLGSRQSEAMLRVYDKSDGNSFGEAVPFTRVELELKGDRAMMGALEVFAAPMQSQHLMAAAILNGFCDVETDWWQEFKLITKAAWLKLRSAVSTVAKIEKWINKAVLPSLATLIAAKSGGDLDAMTTMFQQLIGDGQRRWSARHVSMVANYSGDLTTQFVGAV